MIKSSMTFRLMIAGTALILTLGLTGSAKASPTQQFSFLGGKSGKTIQAKVSKNGGGSFSGLLAVGVYKGTLSNVVGELELFCTDLHHGVGTPFDTLAMLGKIVDPAEALSAQGYYDDGIGTGGGMTSAMTAADYKPLGLGSTPFATISDRVNAVAYLVHTYLNSGAGKQTLGKVQLAIWDIVNDGGDGAGAGAFQAKDSGDVIFDLSGILTEAGNWKSFATRRPEWIQAPRLLGGRPDPGSHVQDFGYDPVPEPAFYQMSALLAMGGLGFLRRRGKK